MNAKKRTESATESASEPRRPDVLDLGPEAVVDHDAHQPQEAATAEPVLTVKPPKKRNWIVPAAALVLGAISGGWLYRDLLASYLPPDQVSTLVTKVQDLEASKTANQELLAGLSKLSEQLKTDVDAIESALNQTSTTLTTIKSGTEQSSGRIAKLETTGLETARRVDALKSALATANTSATPGAAIDAVALQAITARLEILEKDFASLKEIKSGIADTAAQAQLLSQSLAGLKAKIDAGAPYTDELIRLEQLVPTADGLDILHAHASEPLQPLQDLGVELATLVTTLPGSPSQTSPADEGYVDWFLSFFGTLVTVKTVGETNWQSVAGDAARLAQSDDVQGAITLIDATSGDKPAALVAWRDKAGVRLKVEEALNQVSDAVARQLAAKG